MYDTNERIAQVKERAMRIRQKRRNARSAVYRPYVWRFAAVWSVFWVRSAADFAARQRCRA